MRSHSFIGFCVVLAALAGCNARVGGRTTRDGGTTADSGPRHYSCNDVNMDGIPDEAEVTPVPGVTGDALDEDGDGFSNRVESISNYPGFSHGTMLHMCTGPDDCDGDMLPNFQDPDSDNDGLLDSQELTAHTDPCNIDTDGDGVSDLAEVTAGTSPTDITSTIPSTDFFVVLPYNGDHANRNLDFGTNITKADVYFLVDTTGSMAGPIANVNSGLASIAAAVRAMVPDTDFGVGLHKDFPLSPYGSTGFGGPGDTPYQNLQDITPDLSLINAALTLSSSGGSDEPESQIAAVWMTATGMGMSFTDDTGATETIPPKVCIGSPDDPSPPRGYPCFRPGALPIVVQVTDAQFHNGTNAGNDYGPGLVTSGLNPHTADAVAALNDIGARYIGVNVTDGDGMAHADEAAIAMGTGSVTASGPLVVDGDPSMTATQITSAITSLVGGTPEDVSTRTANVTMPPNPDNFDATLFIKSITPVNGVGPHGESGPMPGITFDRMDATTFYHVIPGTIVTFAVDFWNDVRPPASVTQIFQATIYVVGNGVADLSSRHVYIVVPLEGGMVMLH